MAPSIQEGSRGALRYFPPLVLRGGTGWAGRGGARNVPHPNPPPEYQGRGQENTPVAFVSDFSAKAKPPQFRI